MSRSVVDVHAHVLLPQLQEHVAGLDPAGLEAQRDLEHRRQGPESIAASGRMIGERIAQLTDVDRRLADMDAAGVDVQIVSPSPSHYYYFLGRDHAMDVARRANAAVHDLVHRAPDRLHGLGLVPLQHPGLMVEALEDAVVDHGLLGVEIGSFAPASADGGPAGAGSGDDPAPAGGAKRAGGEATATVELSDDRLEPFWARAAELGAVVFLHPFGCSLDARLDRFYLANTVAQPAENAVALSHLIFAGVLDRHPDLKVVAAHGGGYLPTTIGRSDRAWHVRPEAQRCAEPPSHYLRRLYFDSLTHDARELRALVAVAGADRVLVGSDYPFDMGFEDPVGAVRAAGLGRELEDSVLTGTAAALGLRPATISLAR